MAEEQAVRRRGPYLVTPIPGVVGLTEQVHERTGRVRWNLVVYANSLRVERVIPARNRTEAKGLAEELRQQIRGGDQALIAPSKTKLDDLFALWTEHMESLIASGERSQRTLDLAEQRYGKFVKPTLGRVRIADITKAHIVRVLVSVRNEGKSTSLQDSVRDILSGVLQHGVDNDLLRLNVVRTLSKKQRPTVRVEKPTYVLSRDEVEKILKATPSGWRTFFTLLADSGLRVNECLGLTWSRIDFEANLIRVTHQLGRDPDKLLVALKTDKSKRNVPMTSRVRHLLLTHKMASSFKVDSDLVFSTSTGKSPGYNNGRRALQSALDKIALHPGDARLGIHALRHFYGTALLGDGVHFQIVSRLLGHSTPAVTLSTYAHVFETLQASDLAAQVEKALGGTAAVGS